MFKGKCEYSIPFVQNTLKYYLNCIQNNYILKNVPLSELFIDLIIMKRSISPQYRLHRELYLTSDSHFINFFLTCEI